MKNIQSRNKQAGEVSTGSLRFLAGIVVFIGVLAGIAYFWGQSASAPNLAWIVCLLLGMCVWEAFSPGGGPRIGILRFETTRGDRLFLSLLGSGFIHLAWLGLVGPDLWKALGISIAYALLVFTLV
jgi:predicted small integral membrane protein